MLEDCALTLPTTLAVVGTLKGYDQLLNLVMDDLEEAVNGTSVLSATGSLNSRLRFRTQIPRQVSPMSPPVRAPSAWPSCAGPVWSSSVRLTGPSHPSLS